MKITAGYGRRINVPIEEFKIVTYEHYFEVSYNDEESKKSSDDFETILETILESLEELVDKHQRKKIKEETGITKLIFDLSKGEKLRLKKK